MGPKRPPLDSAILEELLTHRHSKWNLTIVLHLRAETKRFSELQREIGTISQKISRQDPETIKRIKAAYDELTREFAGPDGRLVLRYHALLASGRA